MLMRLDMNVSTNARLAGAAGLLGLLALVQGCEVQITNNDDCGPQPEQGPCGSTFECVDGHWIEADSAGCECPFGEPTEGEACSGGDLCEYPSESECDGTASYQCTEVGWIAVDEDWNSCQTCPEFMPNDSSDCPSVGLRCEYTEEVDCGGNTTVVSECTEDGWTSYWPRCLPEPICPPLAPEPGTDCTGWADAYYCQFSLSCSPDAFIDMHCDFGITPPLWVVDYVQPCEGSCWGADQSSCLVTDGCQWLEPGCSDEPQQPIAEGCYPKDDCLVTGCDDNQICTPFVYDPCVDSGCNACGAEFNLCISAKLGGGD